MRYTVVLLPDEEEPGFTVVVPELPGCVTQGDTIEQALDRAREAIEGHLQSLASHGEEIPEETAPLIVATVEVNADLAVLRS